MSGWAAVGSAASGALGAFANVYSAKQYVKAQKQINQSQIDLADKQMAFQEYMSSTAHQREVEDLEAAGLNPVLSANSGASSAGGAMATLNNPEAMSVQATGQAVNSAREAVRIGMEKVLNKALVRKAEQETMTNAKLQDKLETESQLLRQDVKMKYWDRRQRDIIGAFQQSKTGKVVSKMGYSAKQLGQVLNNLVALIGVKGISGSISKSLIKGKN